MNIEELVRQDYMAAVRVTESKAREFPAGSAEQQHWFQVAAVYRELTRISGDPAAAPSRWKNRAPVLAVEK